MPKFLRPQSLKYPQVYGNFRTKNKNGDKLTDYLIQDLPEEYFDVALDLLVKEHLRDELFHESRGVLKNHDAVREAYNDWRRKLKNRFSIACFTCEGTDLVGVNVLGVVSKDDDDSDEINNQQTLEFKDVMGVQDYIGMQHNVFEKYGEDKFLTDYGLVINRDYRQRGIAGEFMKARIEVAKALNLKIVSSVFTAVGSQKAAEKVGFKETFSISFEELGKVFPSFDFSKTSATDVKILDYKI
ncbi:uncharacterized protein [Chironomus tepperi]|uniref:uncharacterized protein isoform X1 n=1 Tax=Chironomus tepperi TaxID=113505 RepID=UPI00391F3ED0